MNVAVLLLNWNTAEYTLNCIESLFDGTIKPDLIMVIDNMSKDRSVNNIENRFTTVKLIKNDRNYGFAEGNNIGLRILLKEKPNYIWILNNDTIVDKHCLEYLLNEFENNDGISAVTGKIMYPPPNDRKIWYAGANFNFWTLKVKHRGALKYDFGQYDKAEDVPFISGCCMLVKRSAFEKIGLFDSNFFAYLEDFDWCLRARKEGLRLRYVPKAIIYHYVSSSLHKNKGEISGGTSSPLGVYLVNRNRVIIIRKHASNLMQLIIGFIDYFGFFVFYAMGLFILLRIDKLKALFLGVRDGLFQRIHRSIRAEENQYELIKKYGFL